MRARHRRIGVLLGYASSLFVRMLYDVAALLTAGKLSSAMPAAVCRVVRCKRSADCMHAVAVLIMHPTVTLAA